MPGIASRSDDVGGVVDGEEELTVGAGRDADRLDAGEPAEMALEAGDARDAHEADDDDLGRLRLGRASLVAALARDEPGEAGGEGVVADLGDLLASLAESAAWRGLGLGGVVVGRQAEGRDAEVVRLVGCGVVVGAADDLDGGVGHGFRGVSARPRRWRRLRRRPGLPRTRPRGRARRRRRPHRPRRSRRRCRLRRPSRRSAFAGARPRSPSTWASVSPVGPRRLSTTGGDARSDSHRIVSGLGRASARRRTRCGCGSTSPRTAGARAGARPSSRSGSDLPRRGGARRTRPSPLRSRRHGRLDALDLALDHRGVLLDLGLEPALAVGDPGLGLLADAGDLGLRPLADRGDVVVGLAAEVGRLGRGAVVDLLDVGLRLGLELSQVRVGPPRPRPASPS